MSSEVARFGDLFNVPQRNGLTRPKKVRGSGLPMVNMGELFAYPRIRNISMDLVPIDVKEHHYLLETGDLLFARQSLVLSGAGQCSIFLGNDSPTVFESHLIRCRLNPISSNPLFYFYFFRSPDGRRVIEAIVEQGAGASGIRGSDLVNVQVPNPPKQIQDEVARLLGSIDDRITLLRETNTTLEAIAQALFKSWFVDFDPVHAKMAGRAPEGMDEATAALFPDSFEESELGVVPKGWQVASIYEVAKVIYGAPFASKQFKSEPPGKPLVRIRDLKDEAPGLYTEEVHPKGYLIQPGDITVGMDGEFRAYLWGGEEAWLNQRVCIFQPINSANSVFVRLIITPLLAAVEASETATTVIHLGKNDIDRFNLILPGNLLLCSFESLTTPMYQRVVRNKQLIQNLAALRDTLLPRLISGQLSLAEVEKETI